MLIRALLALLAVALCGWGQTKDKQPPAVNFYGWGTNVFGKVAPDGLCRPIGGVCRITKDANDPPFLFIDARGKRVSIAAESRRWLEYDAVTGVVEWSGPNLNGDGMEHWSQTVPVAYRPAFERFLWPGGRE